MPAIGTNGQPNATKCGDYYCDANTVCGEYCPEMDVMEANTHAFQVTPHTCDTPSNGHYYNCDGGGCGQNSKNQGSNAYGPGGNYQIDTTRSFDVTTQFQTDGSGQLSTIITTLKQSGKSISFNHNTGNCNRLASMTEAFRAGMVLTVAYWGDKASTMSWLDIPPCSSNTDCNVNTSITFSNIQVY